MVRIKLSIAWGMDVLESRKSGKLAFLVKTSQELCNAVSDLFEVSKRNSC